MSGAATRGAPAGQPAMFNNSLFNSTGSGSGMPQYVQQPSSQGSQPDVIGTRKGKPVYGPPKAFSPTMAAPAWAQQPAPGSGFAAGLVQRIFADSAAQNTPAQAAPQFSNPLFNSAPNPYIAAPQAVMQPSSAAAPAKGAK